MAASPAPAPAFAQAASAPTGGETQKLTLNERWKQLPPWVQWMVIGVFIVVLGVIIFAMPTGGGNTSPEPEKPIQGSGVRGQGSEVRGEGAGDKSQELDVKHRKQSSDP
jgi:hypothetical protein